MAITNFQDFADQLCQAKNYDESFSTYNQYVEFLGFQSALYSYASCIVLDEQSPLDIKFSVSDNYDLEYLNQYTQLGFDKVDYVAKKIIAGETKILDWWDDAKRGKLNSQQIKILDIMRDDYQITNGLSIPLSAGSRGVAAASVMNQENDRLHKQLKSETLSTLQTATTIFHNHVITNALEFNAFIEPILPQFNETERKVLKLLLEGYPIPKISTMLCKSRGYMENVVRNIRIKMAGLDSNEKPKISKDLLIHYCGLMGIYNEL